MIGKLGMMHCRGNSGFKFLVFQWLNKTLSLALILILLMNLAATASQAEEPLQDKVILTLSDANGVIADLEYMVKGLAKQNKQWLNNIEPNIELFLDGVDRTRPIRVDAFFDEKQAEFYRPFFPVSNLVAFKNNLDALGITTTPIANNLFTLGSAFEGQLRLIHQYGAIAPTGWEQYIPETLDDPLRPIKNLLTPKYDAFVLIDHEPEGLQRRGQALNAVRKNMLAKVKKKSTESQAEFEFRQLLVNNKFDQLQKLYAEIDYLEAGWTTDSTNNRGVGDLLLSGLPGTDLAEKLALIENLKSRFSHLKGVDKTVANMHLQLPVTADDQTRLKKVYTTYQPILNAKITDHKKMNGEQKKAAQLGVDKIIQLLIDGFELGMVDLYGDVRPAQKSGLHEAVVALQLKKGKKVTEILKLVPQINTKFTLKENVAAVAGFEIHQIILGESVPPMMNAMFGTPCQMNFAVSEDILIVGIGDDSLAWVQQVSQEVSDRPEPGKLTDFIRIQGHIGPFMKALAAREPNDNRPKLRGMLIEAFSQGDDYIDFRDKYVNGQVQGTMTVEPGLLRFLGLAVAKFAEENL